MDDDDDDDDDDDQCSFVYKFRGCIFAKSIFVNKVSGFFCVFLQSLRVSVIVSGCIFAKSPGSFVFFCKVSGDFCVFFKVSGLV